VKVSYYPLLVMPCYTKAVNPKIIFEDPNIIVLDKPVGLLSQGDISGENNLVDWLRRYLGRHYVGLIHRLDRNTSGIMVVAKRTKAANRLTASLQKGKLERKYLAWIIGSLKKPAVWKHHLLKDEKMNQMKVVLKPSSKSKEAVLKVQPIGYGKLAGQNLTLAEFKLQTGRSHQIRIQSQAEGYSVLGDVKYKIKNVNQLSFPRPALHSYKISFPHPISGETLHFESPLPEDMAAIKVACR